MTVWMPSLNSMYAARYRSVCGRRRSARNDASSSLLPAVRTDPPAGSTVAADRVRSRRNVMIENPPHQSPAEQSDSRTARPSLMPSAAAFCSSARFASEQHAAAKVAERVPAARHLVPPVRAGDVVEEGVVQHQRRAKAEIGDNEEQSAGEIAIVADEEEQAGGRAARVAEERHQPLLQVRVIGDRAEDRQEEDLQEHRKADAERKERFRRHEKRPSIEDDAVLADVRPRERRQVRAGHHGEDRRLKSGVGPVVHGPAENLAAIVDGHVLSAAGEHQERQHDHHRRRWSRRRR